MQCQGKTREGKCCNARALVGSNRCSIHAHPGRAAELGRKGGRRRAIRVPDALKEFEAPQSAAHLRDLLAQSIIEIRAGKLDPRVANSISYLGAGFLRALEVSEIETRIAALEKSQRTVEPECEPPADNNLYAKIFSKRPTQ